MELSAGSFCGGLSVALREISSSRFICVKDYLPAVVAGMILIC